MLLPHFTNARHLDDTELLYKASPVSLSSPDVTMAFYAALLDERCTTELEVSMLERDLVRIKGSKLYFNLNHVHGQRVPMQQAVVEKLLGAPFMLRVEFRATSGEPAHVVHRQCSFSKVLGRADFDYAAAGKPKVLVVRVA